MNAPKTTRRWATWPRSAAGVFVAVTILLFAGYLAWVFAFGVMYLTEPGPARLVEMRGGLSMSVVVGVLGVLAARAVLDRSWRLWWLLGGAVPAVLAALTHSGVVG